MTKRTTQIQLSKAWNKKFVKQKKQSFGDVDYVDHTQVTQKLIALIPDLEMKLGSYVYDKIEDENGNTRKFLTGVDYTISGTIDGEFRTVTEAGMCDKPFYNEDPRKISNNGQRLKECISDAVKRCAMRLGVGIELYDSEAWLSNYLDKDQGIVEHDTKVKYTQSKTTKPNENDLANGKQKMDNLVTDLKTKKDVTT
jgi:hypothetical protein